MRYSASLSPTSREPQMPTANDPDPLAWQKYELAVAEWEEAQAIAVIEQRERANMQAREDARLERRRRLWKVWRLPLALSIAASSIFLIVYGLNHIPAPIVTMTQPHHDNGFVTARIGNLNTLLLQYQKDKQEIGKGDDTATKAHMRSILAEMHQTVDELYPSEVPVRIQQFLNEETTP
jgi:hypothetical protein